MAEVDDRLQPQRAHRRHHLVREAPVVAAGAGADEMQRRPVAQMADAHLARQLQVALPMLIMAARRHLVVPPAPALDGRIAAFDAGREDEAAVPVRRFGFKTAGRARRREPGADAPRAVADRMRVERAQHRAVDQVTKQQANGLTPADCAEDRREVDGDNGSAILHQLELRPGERERERGRDQREDQPLEQGPPVEQRPEEIGVEDRPERADDQVRRKSRRPPQGRPCVGRG